MEGLQTALTTWGNAFTTDATSMITTLAPIGLTVVGTGMALMFGIKKFRQIANKA